MIIDFRSRPPFDNSFRYLTTEVNKASYRIISGFETAESVEAFSMVKYFEEMRDAGIDKGLITGRRSCHGFIDEIPGKENENNDAVKEILEKYPDKFIGAYGIDPTDGEKAIKWIEQYVVNGAFSAVLIEPDLAKIPMSVDDKRVLPFYDYCEANNIPVLLAFGELNYQSMRHMSPTALDNICEMFGNLKIIIFHGGWPYVSEVLWIAFNRENFYISPDYTMLPAWAGYEGYINAANTFMQDKIIFGSSYPFVAMGPMKQYYESVLRPEVVPKVLGANAMRALNMELSENCPPVAPHVTRPPVPREISDLDLWDEYEKQY